LGSGLPATWSPLARSRPQTTDHRPGSQLDLLGEGPVLDAFIDVGLAHSRHLKHLWEAQEARLGSIAGGHGSKAEGSDDRALLSLQPGLGSSS